MNWLYIYIAGFLITSFIVIDKNSKLNDAFYVIALIVIVSMWPIMWTFVLLQAFFAQIKWWKS